MHRGMRVTALSVSLFLSLILGIMLITSHSLGVQGAASASPINLYFHNDTSNPPVGGGLTRTTSTANTSQGWSARPQGYLNFTSRATLDFYLHPDLAGNFTINGTIFIHPWVAGSGTGGSTTKAGFTVALYDVSSSGQTLVATSASSGSQAVAFGSSPAQARDVNSIAGNSPLTFFMASHTFYTGHSILVHLEILPQGSGSTLFFYFDNQATPSYATLYSQTIVSVANTWTTNSAGSSVNEFAMAGANLQVNMLASITDPLGGYDLNASALQATYARVTLNLVSPSGNQLLVIQRMNLITGGQLSFQNLFRLNYTIAAAASGQYNYTVTATDNSGNVALGNGSFRVTSSSSGSPFTSTLAIQLVSLALLLILLAGIVIYASRRRSKAKAPASGSTPKPQGS